MNIPTLPFSPWWIVGAAGAALVTVIGFQHVRIADLKVDVATLEKNAAGDRADRATLVADHRKEMAEVRELHTKAQQEKDDAFTTKLNTLQAARAADAVLTGSLRRDLATYAARGSRAGETDAARADRAEDRLAALAGLLDEGIGLATEGRDVVGRRDAEVKVLVDQVRIDRTACSAVSK